MGATYALNVGVGLVGLQMVNVPMFFCLRRLVAPMILLYEFLVMGRVASSGVNGSVSIIVLGTLLAGWGTLNDDLLGYTLVMLNNVLTAAASVLQKQVSDRSKLSTVGIVYANALIAAPLALLLLIATGEVDKIAGFRYVDSGVFWAGFFVSSIMGFFLTFTSILSTTYNSPLATSITGNAKDIATTAIGWIVFPGFEPTFSSVGGISLSFLGAFLYSAVSLRQQQQKAATALAGKVGAGGEAASAASPARGEDADSDTGRLIGADSAVAEVSDGATSPDAIDTLARRFLDSWLR